MRIRNGYSLMPFFAALIVVGVASYQSRTTAQYILTEIGTLPEHDHSYAYGINNSGQVVGYSGESLGEQLGFFWEDKVITTLGTLGGESSYAYGINDSGVAVGLSTNEEGYTHAFLGTPGALTDLGTLSGAESVGNAVNNLGQVTGWSWLYWDWTLHAFFYDGEMIDLGTLGRETSQGWDINDSGQVVGESEDGNGNIRGFLWVDKNHNGERDAGEMSDLHTLGGVNSFGYGINNSGQVVGSSETAYLELHAFLWREGVMTDLGTLGGFRSEAYGINESGQVVGWSDLFSSGRHAFLWQDGAISDLNDLIPAELSWELLEAWDINDSGQIVGYGVVDGQEHAFLLTPFLLTVSAGGDGFSLSWNNVGEDYVYTVEHCDSLSAGHWTPTPPLEQWPIPATTWMDNSRSESEKHFYRIKAEKAAP